jgi:hypothetical protein
MWMRTTILLISLLYLFLFFAIQYTGTNGYHNEDEIIVWQENRPLTWGDFKGKPAKRFSAASTNYDIIKTVQAVNSDSAKATIQAIFFCKKSWKKESWIDSTILVHEQKHFDIVELYARKLRKLLLENKYTSEADLKAKSDSLYAIIDKEMDVYQDKYDDETDGSMNGEQQRVWCKKIINEVRALDKYAGTSLIIAFAK